MSTFAGLFENDLKVVLPEFYLLLASLGLLIYGANYSKADALAASGTVARTKCVTPPLLSEPSNKLAALVLVLSAMLLWQNPVEHASIFYNSMVLDAFGRVFKQLMLSAALICMLISIDYLKRQVNAFEYSFLLLFATAGGLFLISSADLLSMFLSLEFQSLCFYVLAALKRHSQFATEAGLKYLVLGAFSSGVLLFGCSLIYGFTGATHLTQLAKLFSCLTNSAYFLGALTGMLFIAVGLLFKLSAAPFHSWAPDVYDGSPSAVTTFFAAVPKISVFAFFIRLLQAGFNDLNALADWSVLFQSRHLYETPPFQKILCAGQVRRRSRFSRSHSEKHC